MGVEDAPPAQHASYPTMPQPQYNAYPETAPPPAYNAAPPAYTTTTVTYTAPIIVAPVITHFGDNPIHMQCPSCSANILTRVTYKTGALAWLICGGLCLAGCWLGCQFIPFCVDSCKDVDHHCPNCNTFLGSRKKI